MTEDRCYTSPTGAHQWKAFHECLYCTQEWLPADPCVDPDEIEAHRFVEPEPEPLWPKVLGAIIAIILIGLIFGPVGGIK